MQLLLPCACKGREEKDFWKCFSRSLSLPSTCTQPYPANTHTTIPCQRDNKREGHHAVQTRPTTLPCRGKAARFPPAPRWDRVGGHLLFLLINRRGRENRKRGKILEKERRAVTERKADRSGEKRKHWKTETEENRAQKKKHREEEERSTTIQAILRPLSSPLEAAPPTTSCHRPSRHWQQPLHREK